MIDLTSCNEDEEKARLIKSVAVEIFAEGGFTLHKCHSNLSQLEKSTGQDSNSHFTQRSTLEPKTARQRF